MDPKLKEELGQLIDKAENLLAASRLPMPDALHVLGMRHGLQEIADRLKAVVGPID